VGAIIQCRDRMLYSFCTFNCQINEVTFNLLVNDWTISLRVLTSDQSKGLATVFGPSSLFFFASN
jgi:hypothetical protein